MSLRLSLFTHIYRDLDCKHYIIKHLFRQRRFSGFEITAIFKRTVNSGRQGFLIVLILLP